MNIEELSSFTEDELSSKANACLKDYDIASAMTRQHQITEAQFYLAEIERRKQAKDRIESGQHAARDYKLELWVIWLIGAELLLAIVAIGVGWMEGSKQMAVLDKLNQSSAATAATLTAVRQAQEASVATQKQTLENIVAMNNSLRAELALNFAEALQFSGGITEEVRVANRARLVSSYGARLVPRTPAGHPKGSERTPSRRLSRFRHLKLE